MRVVQAKRPILRFPALLLLSGLGLAAAAPAADETTPPLTLTIPRLAQPPALEQFLSMEPADDNGLVAVEGFIQLEPEDGQPASQRTVVYLGYDANNFYVVFVCYDTEPRKIRARLTKREQFFSDDSVILLLDTFHDRRRAYQFEVNPLGIQADGLLAEGQHDDFSFDTLWYSEGKLTAQGYVVSMTIPFRSLRFSSAPSQTWGIAFARELPRNNETSTWPRITSRVEGVLQQAATLQGIENVSPGRNLQFIPFGFFRALRALDPQSTPPRFVSDPAQLDIGLDAKLVFKDSLVLDVALNPDFSQVESDQPQVTVNRRFEVFFPEKRPFFLENSSFFRTPINLVFTRRIADPQFGVRLTGKLGPYALAAFLIDDEAPGKSVPTTDPEFEKLFGKRAFFGILRVNRDLFRQSTLGFIITAREFESSYNRVGGPDLRLKLNPNWVLTAQAVTSTTRDLDGERRAGPAYRVNLDRDGRSFNYFLSYNDFSPKFRADAGFIPRVDTRSVSQFVSYRFWPEGKHIINWGPRLFLSRLWNHAGERQDWVVSPGFNLQFRRQTGFGVSYRIKRERFEGIDFLKRSFGAGMGSSYFSKVSVFGGFNLGTEINFSPATGFEPFLANSTFFDFGTTLRPLTPLRIDTTYLFSRLTQRSTGANIFNNHIARMKINYQFTRRLTLRTIFQYEATLANPDLTTFQTTKRFTGDFLLTYLVNPWTVLYVGYNNLLENLDPRLLEVDGQLLRTRKSFLETGKQFFVKFSYLFRF